jgi:hypothetical protein
MVSLDSDTVLTAAGTLLGMITVGYFASVDVFGLSTVAKLPAVAWFVVAFIVGGLLVEERELALSLYVLGAFSYAATLWFVFAAFSPEPPVAFPLLLVSSAALLVAAHLVRERDPHIDRRRAVIVIGAASAVVVLLAAVDLAGSPIGYAVALDDTVALNASRGGFVAFGSVTVSNDHVLPRKAEEPRVGAALCLPENADGPPVVPMGGTARWDDAPERPPDARWLGPGEEITATVGAHVRDLRRTDEGVRYPARAPIVRVDSQAATERYCAERAERPTIAVYLGT